MRQRKNKIGLCVFIWMMCLSGLLPRLSAAQDVIVKGLKEGRAILSIDGDLVILRQGQTERGVKLISATNSVAVLEVNGMKQSVPLDQSIAKSYQAPETNRVARGGDPWLWRNSKKITETMTELVSIQWKSESSNEVVLDVEYVYNGEQGDDAYLTIETMLNGNTTGNTNVSGSKLQVGKNTVEVHITMLAQAPVVFRSDALQVNLSYKKNGQDSVLLLTQNLPFAKYWTKVKVR